MSDFYGKLPFSQAISQNQYYNFLAFAQKQGWELPCEVTEISPDGALVTVSFAIREVPMQLPKITIPIAQSKYMRPPIQIGDKGVTRKIDVSILPISGQEPGNADFGNTGNLNAVLFFQPISNLFDEPNALPGYGWITYPIGSGWHISNMLGTTQITINDEGINMIAPLITINGVPFPGV